MIMETNCPVFCILASFLSTNIHLEWLPYSSLHFYACRNIINLLSSEAIHNYVDFLKASGKTKCCWYCFTTESEGLRVYFLCHIQLCLHVYRSIKWGCSSAKQPQSLTLCGVVRCSAVFSTVVIDSTVWLYVFS